MQTNITFKDGFTDAQKEKVTKAVDLWERAWLTPEFQARVSKYYFSQLGKASPKVFETITKSQPRQVTYDINNEPSGSEIAATNTYTGTTTLDSIQLDRESILDVVCTLAHEFTHTPQGGSYTHSKYGFWPWRSRVNSVSYAIGTITQDIASRL